MSNKVELFKDYYILYSDVVNIMEHKKYQYMDTNSYFGLYVEGLFKGNVRDLQKIYWEEMLQRIHFAAVTSIIRSPKWLEGVRVGIETKNLIVFSSSFRGFLEATVDSWYSLESMPTSMALKY